MDYLLTTKLFCGHCKAAMTGVSGTSKTEKKYHYYRCVTNRRDKSCNKKTVNKDYIEDVVVQQLQEFLTPDNITTIAKRWLTFARGRATTATQSGFKSCLLKMKRPRRIY